MGHSKLNGSEALAGLLTAFGGVVGVLCTAGLTPVSAVVLGLIAAVVLSAVRA